MLMPLYHQRSFPNIEKFFKVILKSDQVIILICEMEFK